MIHAIDDTLLFLNFICHMVIFIGSFYIALHNRNLPKWHVTPLWYVGLSSFACAITILCQWGMGPNFPLSYHNIGTLTEVFSNISLSAIAVIFLTLTVRKDIKGSYNRNSK